MLATIVLMTVAVVRPILILIMEVVAQISGLEEWRSWPIRFASLSSNGKDILGAAGSQVQSVDRCRTRRSRAPPSSSLLQGVDSTRFIRGCLSPCVGTKTEDDTE